MKNKLLILIFSIMLIYSQGLVYANSETAFFDFENYTKDHSSPTGWPSSNTGELGPGVVDEAHGTSFKVKYKGIPIYKFSEPISSGEFLVSFEIYFEDFDQNLRLHAKSPTSGSDAHSLLQFTSGEVRSANTSDGAWVFDKITEIETKRWYQIDMLFNMDTGKLYYYVDGVEYTNKSIAFSDMTHIYFRTESGKNNDAVLYLDNVSFKYKSAGSFDSEFKGGAAQIGKEEVILNFQDLVDSNTINNIEIYNMGANPFSYSSNKVQARAEMAGVKSVKLSLSEPIAKNSIYKVYAPGVKTSFGDYFTNEAVYFATGGASANRVAINADFSTIQETGNRKPISPTSDTTWEKSVINKINPVLSENMEGEEVPVVRFVQNKGSSDLPDNLTTLTRSINTPYEGLVDMEFAVKAKNGKHTFRVKDSEGREVDIIKIIGTDVMVNDTQVKTISADTWYKFTVNADTENKTVKVSVDGIEMFSGDFLIPSSIAGIVFEQRNSLDTYGTDIQTDDLAEMYIEYFKLFAEEECTSVMLINFEDTNGKLHYPDGDIPTDINKINLIFSDEIKSSTLDKAIIFDEWVVDDYSYSNGIYSINVPDYLNGLKNYKISIKDTIKDNNDKFVMNQEGTVRTDSGLFLGTSFTLDETQDGYTVNADIIHTDLSCNDIYVALAEFKGNLMISYKLDRIAPTVNDRKIKFSNTYIKNEEADKAVAFLWDGFDSMNPVLKAQIIKK